jgi:hypothetical protein
MARKGTWTAAALVLTLLLARAAMADDTVLFDFENPADLADWSPVTVQQVVAPKPASKPAGDSKTALIPAAPWPAALGTQSETGSTAASVQLADQDPSSMPGVVTHGKKCLKITFHGGVWPGGTWPGIVNAKLPVCGDWQQYNSIKLDMTTEKPCLAGLRITQRKGPDDFGATWERTVYLQAGKNEVLAYLKHPAGWEPLDAKFGEVVSMVLYMYRPTEGQALYVDNVRLSREKPTRNIFYDPLWGPYCIYGQSMFNTADFLKSGKLPEFRVAGTDLVAADCAALAAKLKDKWTAPAARTLDQVEADFQKKYEETKKKHPKAVLAVFRDGQPSYDPANPEKIYLGWKDAHLDCHSPDGPLPGRENNSGKNETLEVFMRHRALLAQADLSSIPQGSTILAAQLVLNRVPNASRDATKEPTMWVAEPCMRDWNEYEVNCYQYAAGKLWKAMSGCCYYGDDPDFLPLFIAHGPTVSTSTTDSSSTATARTTS